MASFRAIRYRHWLLVALLGLLGVSAVDPANPRDFLLEHALTAAGLASLAWVDRRRPLSNVSCTLIFLYLTLHVLGAHYTYSFVPYDRWAAHLTGMTISELFEFQRNHFDRLVHFCFGLLLLRPAIEIVQRFLPLDCLRAMLVAIAFLSTFSMLYELMEWAFAETMSADAAETYNGQQGDVFDAQKDMALALAGSGVAAGVYWMRVRFGLPIPRAVRKDSPRLRESHNGAKPPATADLRQAVG